MTERFAFVEFDASGRPVRIFRTEEQAKLSDAWDVGLVKVWSQTRAVAAIRRRVFERDGWACVHCGATLGWEKLEMDERVPRSTGGEISLENSQTLCHPCHMEKHDRVPQWTR